jgi:hypothetical protein
MMDALEIMMAVMISNVAPKDGISIVERMLD